MLFRITKTNFKNVFHHFKTFLLLNIGRDTLNTLKALARQRHTHNKEVAHHINTTEKNGREKTHKERKARSRHTLPSEWPLDR
jgi:hypothetical protein